MMTSAPGASSRLETVGESVWKLSVSSNKSTTVPGCKVNCILFAWLAFLNDLWVLGPAFHFFLASDDVNTAKWSYEALALSSGMLVGSKGEQRMYDSTGLLPITFNS